MSKNTMAPMPCGAERGAALLMALFVLVLLTGMGAALLFLGQHETRASRSSLRAKKAFYLAEAAVEDARRSLFLVNGDGDFTDELEAAAGANAVLDLDAPALQVIYDGAGQVTGFSGFGDDVPLRALVPLGGGTAGPGWYAAFLTNEPLEGVDETADVNERVMLTGIGAGDDRSVEVVQAIVEKYRFVPNVPAAALTLLGPDPHYDNGNSNSQAHTGNDCGVAGGPFAPVVGTVGGDAADTVRDDMHRPDLFTSGPYTGEDTVGDLTDPTDPIVGDAGHGPIDGLWLECLNLKQLVEFLELVADFYCNSDVDSCTLPAAAPDDVLFIDGDLDSTPAGNNTGVLVVTGELTYKGNTGWDGLILVIGEGHIERSGGGSGNPSGGVVVAAIDPTPDGPAADRSDWCTTPPDGFGQAYYDTSGAGNSEVEWCSANINLSNAVRSYRVAEFLQR